MSRSIRQAYPVATAPAKETIYCPAQTRSARLWVDPEPAEWCENEVADYGDYCEAHDYPDHD